MTRAMEKMLLTDVCLPFGEFPGWETVAKGKALNETPQEGISWRYFALCSLFVRASDKVCIPYGLALFRERRLPNGRKSREFLSAFRHPQNVDDFKKQKEKVRQRMRSAEESAKKREAAEKKLKAFREATTHLSTCLRDEIRYKDNGRTIKNITWYNDSDKMIAAFGYFYSFDRGKTWAGVIRGAWLGSSHTGDAAVQLMPCGIERSVKTGTRVCLPTTKHGWLEFIIDPETLIDIPAESQQDGRSESAYTLTFTTNDRRAWLLQNCAPQANIPAGKAPLILQMPEIKTAN